MTTCRLARTLLTAATVITITAYTVAYGLTFAWVTTTAKGD